MTARLRDGLVALAALVLCGCATWGDEENLWFDAPDGSGHAVEAEYGYNVSSLDPEEYEPLAEYGVMGVAGGGARSAAVHSSTRCTLTMVTARTRPIMPAVEIRKTVRKHENEIRLCYNRALRRERDTHGRVVMTFDIEPGGTVPRAIVSSSEIRDAQMQRCMTRAVLRWRFIVPAGLGRIQVNYPYVFSVPPRASRRQ